MGSLDRTNELREAPKWEQNPIDMAESQQELEAEANRILAQAGYKADGRETSAKRESLRAVSTPFGGKPGYKLK